MQWSYCKSGEELVITKINNTLEQVGMILQIVFGLDRAPSSLEGFFWIMVLASGVSPE